MRTLVSDFMCLFTSLQSNIDIFIAYYNNNDDGNNKNNNNNNNDNNNN
jgi:hypothetical protein